MDKILVLTDSLGLPRDTPEELLYEQTWPYLLKQKGYTVAQASIGGGTSFDLYKQAAYYKMFKPNIVVIQVGIVDCAPRALDFYENILLNHWLLTRKLLNVILNRWERPIRKIRHITYIKPTMFEDNIRKIIHFLPNAKVFCISIIPASSNYERKLPGIQTRVKEYNQLLLKIFKENYITMEEIPPSYIMNDYHHLNANGHQFVVDQLILRLKDELSDYS